MATSLKLDDETKERVRSAAQRRERSPHWVMKRAVEEFLGREEKREAFRAEAREALAQYRKDGEHLTLDETLEWMSRWGTEEETKAPECHR